MPHPRKLLQDPKLYYDMSEPGTSASAFFRRSSWGHDMLCRRSGLVIRTA